MSKSQSRIEPMVEPFEPDVHEELRRWMPPDAPVEPLALFRTLVRNLGLSAAMRPLGEFQLSQRSSLPIRVRELVIDRTTARLGAEYEWGVHVGGFGAAAGLSEAELAATAVGAAADFDGTDGLVVEFVDALVDDHTVSDELWSRLSAHFDVGQLLELVVLCGWYHIIGFVVNVAELPGEQWAATFPSSEVAS